MDEIATIVAAGAVLGALAGWIGPGRWRWHLVRLAPLLLVPFALYVLATRSWIFGGGGPLVEPSLLVVCGRLGYLGGAGNVAAALGSAARCRPGAGSLKLLAAPPIPSLEPAAGSRCRTRGCLRWAARAVCSAAV